MSAVTVEPNTTARVTSARYFSSRARRPCSTGIRRVRASSIARPSRNKKNSMNSIMKKPTRVPIAPSATLPPMEARREPLVQGIQDERQYHRPAEHAAQGAEDPEQQVAEDRRGRDLKAAAVEVRWHGL